MTLSPRPTEERRRLPFSREIAILALHAAAPSRLTQEERDEYRSQMITPLALGADSGRRMGPSRLVVPLANAPERPIVELTATLGKDDSLARAMELTPGESVLDCTCGLGADAILAAHMVGNDGRVCALEASAPLALLVGEGMASYTLEHPEELTQAMRRIEVRHADFAHALRQAEESTWDVVYFDPMFNETIDAATGLDLVRRLGHSGIPSPADLDQARRVARRRVVMKDRLPAFRTVNCLKEFSILLMV